MSDLRLQEIWIYPIKSLGGIRLRSSPVMEKGLQYDRRWMLIDENNMFMTQRTTPKMALFKVAIEGQNLRVNYLNYSTLIPLQTESSGISITSTVWEDDVSVVEVDPVVSSWFSGHLGFSCRLVAFPESNARLVDPDYRLNQENVSLADAYPFLIIGEESLAELNRRLAQRLPMNRFRPNFVFSGGRPNEEDLWTNFKIGKNRFVGVKPCSRCVITTINQDTAQKGIEPLLTLSRYRKRGGGVDFGQNIIALDYHDIFEGDEIILD